MPKVQQFKITAFKCYCRLNCHSKCSLKNNPITLYINTAMIVHKNVIPVKQMRCRETPVKKFHRKILNLNNLHVLLSLKHLQFCCLQ